MKARWFVVGEPLRFYDRFSDILFEVTASQRKPQRIAGTYWLTVKLRTPREGWAIVPIAILMEADETEIPTFALSPPLGGF